MEWQTVVSLFCAGVWGRTAPWRSWIWAGTHHWTSPTLVVCTHVSGMRRLASQYTHVRGSISKLASYEGLQYIGSKICHACVIERPQHITAACVLWSNGSFFLQIKDLLTNLAALEKECPCAGFMYKFIFAIYYSDGACLCTATRYHVMEQDCWQTCYPPTLLWRFSS